MSSKEGNKQPIDHLLVQKTENSESVIISSNMKLELNETSDEHDDNVEEQGSTYVKIEIIKQVNENNETSDELYLEEELQEVVALKEDIISLEENNIEPIDHVFVSKTENSESIIINSNIEEELKGKFDKLDHNVDQQESIKIEIIKQIDYNEETWEKIHPEGKRENQKGVKEDIMLLEEHDIQPIDYFFLSKTENSKLINNLSIEDELAEKSEKFDKNVEQQASVKFKQFNSNRQTFEEVDVEGERGTKLIVEKNTNKRPKRRSTDNVKGESGLIHERKDSLNSITDIVTSCTSTCSVDDLKCQSSSGNNLRCHRATNEKKFVCNECATSFAELRYFVSHLRVHSGKKRLKRKSNLVTHAPTHNGVKLHNCNECSKRFLHHSALVAHIGIHTGEKPYACDQCSKRFNYQHSLVEHIRAHTGEKPYVCDQCNKRFYRQRNLVAHIRTHTEGKPYLCDHCSKRFNQHIHLVTHIRTHTGEKPYACDQCSKRFNHRSNLVAHIRTHIGEKPYVCDQCNKRFKNHAYLVRHIRTHTGEKPFICDQCNKTFSLKHHLVNHIRTHTGERPYVCDQCSKRFNQHIHLVAHIRIHTGEKPYVCHECSKRFNLRSNLNRHIRTHSREKDYFAISEVKGANMENCINDF